MAAWIRCTCGSDVALIGATVRKEECPACGAALAPSRVTVDLPPIAYPIPKSVTELFSGGASPAGHSAISSMLTCPESVRLRTLGVQRKPRQGGMGALSARDFGTLIHALLAIRFVHGISIALDLVDVFPRFSEPGRPDSLVGLTQDDKLAAYAIVKLYDDSYPPERDPLEVLAIEAEVWTDIGDGRGGPLYRSVRYDKVVRDRVTGTVYSMDIKTASRSGGDGQYTSQYIAQAMLWNNNPNLVKRYGAMPGVITDQIVKTKVPQFNRLGPKYVSPWQLKLAQKFMRLPEQLAFQVDPEDGSWPRFLHSCWGKFEPCPYIGLCHDKAFGDYEQKVAA